MVQLQGTLHALFEKHLEVSLHKPFLNFLDKTVRCHGAVWAPARSKTAFHVKTCNLFLHPMEESVLAVPDMGQGDLVGSPPGGLFLHPSFHPLSYKEWHPR